MGKLKQREFILPIVSAVGVALANFFGYEMSTEEIATIAGLVMTAVAGIAGRKWAAGAQSGMAKLAEREFWVPVLGEAMIFANKIWALGMTPETMAWIALTAAGTVAGLFLRKKAVASSPTKRGFR